MAYIGGRLRPWFRRGSTETGLREMAGAGGDRMTGLTVRNTPIETGNLRTSWYQLPVRRRTVDIGSFELPGVRVDYESGVATDVEYAPYVEHGTGLYGPRHQRYPIRPRNPGGVLAFRPRSGGMVVNGIGDLVPGRGGMVFVKEVMHPGSPGAHMVASAAAKVEATMEETTAVPLARWARRTEEQGD